MRAARALLLAAALTACGGSASPSCPADLAPSATPNATADPELAATIPDEVAGEPLNMATFCVTELDGLGGIQTSPEMLEALGVRLEDVTIAAMSPQIGTPGGLVSVGAYRYAGADEDTLRDAFVRLFEQAATEAGIDVDIEEASIGGKEVHRAAGAVYYVADDTLYTVESGNQDKVEEVLGALP
jgi:hypothetical protein